MARAIIVTVDDDPAVSQAITRDLRSRYGDRYRLARSTSGAEALGSLEEFARRDQPVALIVSDHRMPEMTGIELLGRSKVPAPGAKLVLLTAYADTDVAIKAINDIGLDHYLMKPWAPPEERLFPIIDDLLSDWELANTYRFDGVRVVGNRWSERSYETKMFLARNHVQYQWLELERDAEARRLQTLFGGADQALPMVVLSDGTVLHGAGPREIAGATRLGRGQQQRRLSRDRNCGDRWSRLHGAIGGSRPARRRVVPVRQAHDPRSVPDRSGDRGDRTTTRVVGRPGHARRGVGP